MISFLNQKIEDRTKLGYFPVLLGISILLLDQLTKFLTYQFIPPMDHVFYRYPYGGIGVFYHVLGIDFSINYMTNKGAAWGVLGNYQILLIFVRITLVIGLLIYLYKFNRHTSWQIPLVLIITGAIGNVLDFFIYGHVIDMLHFVFWGYDFPVFNIADSAISIGIFSLFLLSWMDS